MLFLYLAIILFLALLIIKSYDNDFKIIETIETQTPGSLSYQNYNDENNAYILAQKNAANIQYLQERLKDTESLENEIKTLANSVKLNTTSIKQVAKIMSQEIGKATGVTPGAATKFAASQQPTYSTSNSTSTSTSTSTLIKPPPGPPLPKN